MSAALDVLVGLVSAATPYALGETLGRAAYRAGVELPEDEHAAALEALLGAAPPEARAALRGKAASGLQRGAKRAASALRAVEDGAAAPDLRPLVRVRKGEGHEHVAAAVVALAADPELYERKNTLVHVVGAPAEAENAGTPVVRTMSLSTLWERCSRFARWERWDARTSQFVPDDPPSAVLGAVLSRGDYPGMRKLTGIIECPSLRPDGTLIFGRGYDAATGFLCLPSEDFRPPVAEPTQADAAAALGELTEIFEQMPHRSPEDKMVPVAAILTLLARPAIVGCCPAFVFDASTRASGKTLSADVVSLVATGRVPPPMSFPDQEEELAKVIGAVAMAAPAVLKWDNLTGRFGGGSLDAVLTAHDTTSFRVLGRTEFVELPWRVIQFVTGNNVELKGDTSRRCLVSRIEPTVERPEERTGFAHPDLRAWVRAERVRLVRAGLTVLRAWVAAGRPNGGCATWGGGFEHWSQTIPAAIVFAGGADPLACRPAVTGEEEPEKAALRVILSGLRRLDPTGAGMTAKAILAALYPEDRHEGPPDGWDDTREAIEELVPTRPGTRPSSKTFGEKLKHYGHGRIVDGAKLVAETAHAGTKRWKVVTVRT